MVYLLFQNIKKKTSQSDDQVASKFTLIHLKRKLNIKNDNKFKRYKAIKEQT